MLLEPTVVQAASVYIFGKKPSSCPFILTCFSQLMTNHQPSLYSTLSNHPGRRIALLTLTDLLVSYRYKALIPFISTRKNYHPRHGILYIEISKRLYMHLDQPEYKVLVFVHSFL